TPHHGAGTFLHFGYCHLRKAEYTRSLFGWHDGKIQHVRHAFLTQAARASVSNVGGPRDREGAAALDVEHDRIEDAAAVLHGEGADRQVRYVRRYRKRRNGRDRRYGRNRWDRKRRQCRHRRNGERGRRCRRQNGYGGWCRRRRRNRDWRRGRCRWGLLAAPAAPAFEHE